jgi:hypothetical protein
VPVLTTQSDDTLPDLPSSRIHEESDESTRGDTDGESEKSWKELWRLIETLLLQGHRECESDDRRKHIESYSPQILIKEILVPGEDESAEKSECDTEILCPL